MNEPLRLAIRSWPLGEMFNGADQERGGKGKGYRVRCRILKKGYRVRCRILKKGLFFVPAADPHAPQAKGAVSQGLGDGPRARNRGGSSATSILTLRLRCEEQA